MKTPVWNSPETTSINRLPMLNIGHLMTISLDGEWDFQLISNPYEEPNKRWQTIPVPGLWTMVNGDQPFGDKPIYTNVQMLLGKGNELFSHLVDLNQSQLFP